MTSENILAYCFTDMNGSVLESRLENLPMTPASNTKIVTAYLALKKFGMDHVFKTYFGINGHSLVVKGGPTFFFSPFESKFKSDVMKTLGGLQNKTWPDAVILSDPVVDSIRYNPCWQIGDSRHSYQAPVSNFFVNENCRRKDNGNEDQLMESVLDHVNEESYLPVRNPELNFAKLFLRSLNVSQKVPVKSSKSIGMEIPAVHSSSLSHVISHVLVHSCNFYAEVLFKSFSQIGDRPGSWEKSKLIAAEMLSDVEGSSSTQFYDGSGLCKDNFMTPLFTVNLLKSAHRTFGESFLKLFPKPGTGTLRKRLLKYRDAGIIAKTGTLSSVSALSGYIRSTDTLFSIFLNNSLAPAGEREELIDRLVSDFIDRHRNSA